MKQLHNICKAISKGAFIGAKGNSGVILSQFFVGFARFLELYYWTNLKICEKAMNGGRTGI